jgi:hypothetical protein
LTLSRRPDRVAGPVAAVGLVDPRLACRELATTVGLLFVVFGVRERRAGD